MEKRKFPSSAGIRTPDRSRVVTPPTHCKFPQMRPYYCTTTECAYNIHWHIISGVYSGILFTVSGSDVMFTVMAYLQVCQQLRISTVQCNASVNMERAKNRNTVLQQKIDLFHPCYLYEFALKHWLPKCVPRIPEDARPVPRGSMDKFL